MKRPKTPPDFWALIKDINKDWLSVSKHLPIEPKEKYLHWDELRHRQPPGQLTHEEWWAALKFRRQALYKEVPLRDKKGAPFRYLEVDPIPERLHHIDLGTGGRIEMPDEIVSRETKDRYLVASLIEEAITSSQLEGAATTRRVAKEMIRTGRKPGSRSERMILNNFQTMRKIGKFKDEPLTKELVFELHRLITVETLEDRTAAGRFRRSGEKIRVVSHDSGEILHDPPPAEQLEERMKAMCDFANGKTPKGFVHPAIRSIILHFWLAYDHPFVDGNGRVARALFYWSMLHHGFWLFEYVSISQIIRNAPAKYGRAFLYTETDDNDLTYFILYHLDVIRRAVESLHAYIRRKSKELRLLEERLRGAVVLNHRQRVLISHALRHPDQRYTIRSHQTSHNIVYETARKDLYDLRDRRLLKSRKVGKTYYFTPVQALEEKLGSLAPPR